LSYLGIGGTFNRENYNFLLSLSGHLKSRSTNGTYIEGLLIEDILIESQWESEQNHTSKYQIQVELFRPLNQAKANHLPVMVNIHGGGWVLRGLNFRNDEYSKVLNMIVINVYYRLAPEYKYPTAMEDVYSVLHWLSRKEHVLIEDADLDRIIIKGDSAGGNLAAVTSLLSRDRGLNIKIKHQILIYPSIPSYYMSESRVKYSNNYLMSVKEGAWFFNQYIPIDLPERNTSKYISPLKETNFTDIPSALFIMATEDMLYDEGHMYRKHLEKYGVKTEYKDFVSVHGFYNTIWTGTHDEEAFQTIIEYLRRQGY